jgi:hypothetical protein
MAGSNKKKKLSITNTNFSIKTTGKKMGKKTRG